MIVLVILNALLAGPDAATPVPLERLGRLDHPAIREASGLVRSRRHPGVYWTHNDSGNPPALFAVRRDGSLIREYLVATIPLDWEDIATDDQGQLYIGDIGNNGNRLAVRSVLVLDEPDPADDRAAATPLRVKAVVAYRFEPDARFDAEGLVIEGRRALLVAKTRDHRDAAVYALPLDPPTTATNPILPTPAGHLVGFTEPVTGADLTPDGRRLVVCSLGQVGIFEATPGRSEGWRVVTIRSFQANDQIEAVAWDGDDIVIAGEGRGVFRIAARDWQRP